MGKVCAKVCDSSYLGKEVFIISNHPIKFGQNRSWTFQNNINTDTHTGRHTDRHIHADENNTCPKTKFWARLQYRTIQINYYLGSSAIQHCILTVQSHKNPLQTWLEMRWRHELNNKSLQHILSIKFNFEKCREYMIHNIVTFRKNSQVFIFRH